MKHLQQEERAQIQALHDSGKTQEEIAQYLKRSKSTISRELNRHRDAGGRYCYLSAISKAKLNMTRDLERGPSAETIMLIEEKIINEQWSPEQISGWLKKQGTASVSHSWIYQHIRKDREAGGELFNHLRHGSYSKEPREYHGLIKDRIGIEHRPAVINERQRSGDLEIDLIVGPKNRGAILSIIDRKSRYCTLEKLSGKTADEVTRTVLTLLSSCCANLFSITSDNGNEFIEHRKIAKALGIDYYFAHPYASYERGTVENLNGLIRQYVPKGTDFDNIPPSCIKTIENKLNNRPRKVLNYLSPHEYVATQFKKAA
jgi:transposase, IS30 family